ncbi:hypothetical protein Lal_00012744, partial [Lupinus albus]
TSLWKYVPGKREWMFPLQGVGHIKRYCPKLDRRPNVMHAGEARDHGRMVTPSGAGTSGVDDPARDCKLSHYFRLGRVDPNLCVGGGVDVYVLESGCGKSADRVVAVGDLCKVSDQASGMGPMSAKKVRTLLRKRDRLHYGSTCPGKGNGCFHCKEFGHIKRYCPKLDRRPNVMHAGEARDHGRMVTPSGAGTSGVDDPARDCKLSHYFRLGRVDPNLCVGGGVDVYVLESGCGKSADRVVAVGDLCKVSDQASGMGPMSAKKVRTLLRKRDRLHYGSTCPGKGNGCFHCKEFGHIKRYCPKLDRRPNVMHAGEARDHGRMVTPSGAGTSGVDDPARDCKLSHYFRLGRVDPNLCVGGGVDVYVLESGCGKSADRVVAVGDLCKVSDQASGMGPMSAKKVRTLLRKRDRYSFSKCHKRNLYNSVDMRDDVPVGFNPGNGLAISKLCYV